MNYFDILWSQRFGAGGFTPHERSMLKALTENPENHNGIYRGKDLTNVYTIEQIYERVHDGSFEDLYLGDYFTVHLTTDLYTRFTGAAFVAGTTYYEMGGTIIARTWTETQDAEPQSGKVYATKQVAEEDVEYMFGGFDLYLGVGTAVNNVITDHHAVMLPRKTGYNGFYKMHNVNTELTGYKGTDMHNITLPCFAAATRTALNNHVLPRAAKFTSVVNPDVASMAGAGAMGGATKTEVDTVYMSLLNEPQMFGTMILSSSWHEVGVDYNKLPIFNFINPVELDEPSINATWLRCIYGVINGNELFVSSAIGGSVGARGASDTAKVRPFFLFG